jgi:uncharacterized membrane-anchored protein YhcB (DUF1043 family)
MTAEIAFVAGIAVGLVIALLLVIAARQPVSKSARTEHTHPEPKVGLTDVQANTRSNRTNKWH